MSDQRSNAKPTGFINEEYIIPELNTPLLPAIRVRNAWKSYGPKSSIINNLTMTVPRGSIYGLLGASGCGKTTMLSCIVGTRKLDSGFVSVFGKQPGTPESGIPGRIIGYMPQELALYDTLSIGETFTYFGKLYGMTSTEISVQMESLFTVLDLPDKSRLIGSLSGGQQRRTSLGVSLIHEPQLLILDEPTVGVDPLLRERIWDYLCELVGNRGRTVLITTHYIEEAKNAHTVGVMRNGRLLEEASPSRLLEQFGTNCLEDIVLKLFKLNSIEENHDIDGSPQLMLDLKLDHGGEMNDEGDNYYNNLRKIGSLAEKFGKFLYPKKTHEVAKRIETVLKTDTLESVTCLRLKNISDPSKHFSKNIHANFETRKYSLPFNSLDIGDVTADPRCSGNTFVQKINRVVAISYKNLCIVARQKVILLMLLIVPPMNYYVALKSIGGEPKGMKFGVVNPETNYNLDVCRNILQQKNETAVSLDKLSCYFLNEIPADTLTMLPMSSYAEAFQDVLMGHSIGFMEFPQDYSNHSVARVAEGIFASGETLTGSSISIRMDTTNAISALSVQYTLLLGYQRFARATLAENGEEAGKAELPLKFTAIYGVVDDLVSGYGKYIAAALFILLVFYLPAIPTGICCCSDNKNGTFERARIAGATTGELMLGSLILNLVFVLLVIGSGYIVLIYVMHMEIIGSTFLCFTFCLLSGICGGFYGIVLSEIITEELEAILIGAASFAVSLLLCGLTWPIETFPPWLSFLSQYCIPYTGAINSLRAVSSRGWGISHSKIWPGFAILLAWSGIFCVIILIARRRHR